MDEIKFSYISSTPQTRLLLHLCFLFLLGLLPLSLLSQLLPPPSKLSRPHPLHEGQFRHGRHPAFKVIGLDSGRKYYVTCNELREDPLPVLKDVVTVRLVLDGRDGAALLEDASRSEGSVQTPQLLGIGRHAVRTEIGDSLVHTFPGHSKQLIYDQNIDIPRTIT